MEFNLGKPLYNRTSDEIYSQVFAFTMVIYEILFTDITTVLKDSFLRDQLEGCRGKRTFLKMIMRFQFQEK